MKRVLVTGATGNVGRQVAMQLLDKDCRVRALSRNPDVAELPPAIEVVRGDLSDADSLGPCLNGIDAVFLVWTAPASAAPGTVSRIARQARHLVLLTSPHRTPHPFFQQPNPVRELHSELERFIEGAASAWTFLRPGIFADNALAWWARQIREGDVVRWPYAAAETAPIDVRDIAEVAVRALLEPGHHQKEYVLTGPESLTHAAQVGTIGQVIGRRLRYEEMSRDEALRELPFPGQALTMLLDAWEAALGQPAFVTSTVADVTGRPARTYREWVLGHGDDFRSAGGLKR